MKTENDKTEAQIKKLKQLQEKTDDPKIKASIAEKQAHTTKPFNK